MWNWVTFHKTCSSDHSNNNWQVFFWIQLGLLYLHFISYKWVFRLYFFAWFKWQQKLAYTCAYALKKICGLIITKLSSNLFDNTYRICYLLLVQDQWIVSTRISRIFGTVQNCIWDITIVLVWWSWCGYFS